jgi:DNA adenine methylase
VELEERWQRSTDILDVTQQRKYIAACGYYGGKFYPLDFVLPHLLDMRYYCEPCGGSGAVLLNRKRSELDTYNDLDNNVVAFFRAIRDTPNALIRLLAFTPHSREEYRLALEPAADITDLERARRFYVRITQSRNAAPGNASWAYAKRDGKRVRKFTHVENLKDRIKWVAARLRGVQIENDSAINVIRRYDTEETFFYLDPPYHPDSRNTHQHSSSPHDYLHEMTDADHQELAVELHCCLGKVAISGYRCDAMDQYYGDWRRYDDEPKGIPGTNRKGSKRQESLWISW